MEVKREHRHPIGRHNSAKVSILVLMEVKREHVNAGYSGHANVVSILVLMEVKREIREGRFTPAPGAGFNPCFDGSEARARACHHFIFRWTEFQSLF